MKLRFYLTGGCMALASLWSTVSAMDIWQREKGYRGFADIGFSIPLGEDPELNSPIYWHTVLSTTHGYQVIPSYLFIGGGAGIEFNWTSFYIPVYADFRTQLPTGKWSPFVDVKLGYGFHPGYCNEWINLLHFAPSIGVTLSTKHRIGFDFSLGYALKGGQDKFYGPVEVNGTYEEQLHHRWVNAGGIEIKFGITF